MDTPRELSSINNITVSGRIGSGATTLAEHLARTLGWEMFNGGGLFRKLSAEMGLDINNSNSRPDHFDLEYEERVKKMLREGRHHVIQSHLAGYDAQGIDGVFKILVVCEDAEGNDKMDIRIDRLVNRDKKSVEDAKEEVIRREREHTEKFRRLYAKGDPNWFYWNKDYYDLIVNTYSHNQEESLKVVLQALSGLA